MLDLTPEQRELKQANCKHAHNIIVGAGKVYMCINCMLKRPIPIDEQIEVKHQRG